MRIEKPVRYLARRYVAGVCYWGEGIVMCCKSWWSVLTKTQARPALQFMVLMLCYLVPASAYAMDESSVTTWELQHAGKHRLVWFYDSKEAQRINRPDRVLVGDKEFVVQDGVRPPTINGVYLLEYAKVNFGDEVLDIGTGSGVHAVFAAGKAKRVVATDISAQAVTNAKANARRHGVGQKIDFRVGDLFEPIKEGEKFDVFFFNINFPFETDGDRRKNLHERLFSQIRSYMRPYARIYYQTSFVENLPYIYDMLERNRFRIMEMHTVHMYPSQHQPLFMMVQSQ